MPTGSFRRILSGPTIYLGFGTSRDVAPPGRITDLSIVEPSRGQGNTTTSLQVLDRVPSLK